MRKISFYLILLASSFCLFAGPSNAQQGTSIRVMHTGDDRLGSELVYALRQELARDGQYRLIFGDEPGMRVRIVTLQPTDAGTRSSQTYTIYAVAVTFYMGENGTDMFFDHIVGTCGSDRVTNCARTIAVSVNQAVTAIREALAASN